MKQEAEKFFPHGKIVTLPLADGGDGTLEVLAKAGRLKWRSAVVRGPLGSPVKAVWGVIKSFPHFRGPIAVIEMAKASGLALLKIPNRILEADTFGTGELIRRALIAGCRTIIIGVGGTATGDGGAGALQALGLKFFDRGGKELSARPADLIRLHRLDWTGFDRRMEQAKVYVLCDVTNPLLGPHGSARTFGPQKGATPPEVLFLEKFLKKWAGFARIQTKNEPGAGAAGALAFGLSAFAGAKLVRGTSFIMKALDWKKKAKNASLIFTGEGRLDKTSFSGKPIGEIVKAAPWAKIVAVCGQSKLSAPILRSKGVREVVIMGPSGFRSPAQNLARGTAELLRKIT